MGIISHIKGSLGMSGVTIAQTLPKGQSYKLRPGETIKGSMVLKGGSKAWDITLVDVRLEQDHLKVEMHKIGVKEERKEVHTYKVIDRFFVAGKFALGGGESRTYEFDIPTDPRWAAPQDGMSYRLVAEVQIPNAADDTSIRTVEFQVDAAVAAAPQGAYATPTIPMPMQAGGVPGLAPPMPMGAGGVPPLGAPGGVPPLGPPPLAPPMLGGVPPLGAPGGVPPLPPNPDQMLAMARQQAAAGQLEEAIATAQRSLAADTTPGETLLFIGSLHQQAGRKEQAAQSFWMASAREAANPAIVAGSVRALIDLGELDRAAACVDNARAGHAQSALLHTLEGEAFLRKQDYRTAAAKLGVADQLWVASPARDAAQHAHCDGMRAYALYQAGDYANAAALAKRATSVVPGHPWAAPVLQALGQA